MEIEDLKRIITAIESGRCLAFLGAGACTPYVNDKGNTIGKGSKKEIRALIILLNDRYNHVRVAAAGALGELGKGSEREIAALVEATKDRDYYVRKNAAVALGNLFKTKPEVELLEMLYDYESGLRLGAAHALGQKEKLKEETKAELRRIIKSENEPPYARLAALAAYSLILDKENRVKNE